MNNTDLSFLNQYPISAWEYPRVLLCIPIERAISYAEKVFFQFAAIFSQGPAFAEAPYGRIDIVRNNFVVNLFTTNFTHVLMLDVDHIHPVTIIQQFARWAVLRPDARVISGLNFRRKKPFDPVMGKFNGNGNNHRTTPTEWDPGLQEVDEVGGASLFVHRSVFEELEPPWFFNIYDERVWANDYPGEDIGFSQKVRAAGIKIYVDTMITSPHCTDAVVTEETFRNYMAQHPHEVKDA